MRGTPSKRAKPLTKIPRFALAGCIYRAATARELSIVAFFSTLLGTSWHLFPVAVVAAGQLPQMASRASSNGGPDGGARYYGTLGP